MLHLLDEDRDGIVTRSELYQLELLGLEYARRDKREMPQSFDDLTDTLCIGFNREELKVQLAMQAEAGGDLPRIKQALKVSELQLHAASGGCN